MRKHLFLLCSVFICLLTSVVHEAKAQGTFNALAPGFIVVYGEPFLPPAYSEYVQGFVNGGAGWTFVPTANLLVTAIASTAPQVDFWMGTTHLATFNYSAGNYDYSFEASDPLLLLAGQDYSITTQDLNFARPVEVTPNSLSGGGGPLVSTSSYLSLNGFATVSTNGQLTTVASDIAMLGPDFQFQVQTTPEPRILGLSILGLLCFCTHKFRHRCQN